MKTIDITTCVSAELLAKAQQRSQKLAFNGHLGTHFDVMNKVFPFEYLELNAIVFDVSEVATRAVLPDNTEVQEIGVADIDLSHVKEGMFVAFSTGFIEKEGYATHEYFTHHPQLSYELINALIDKHISIIGMDFAGVRNGKEHSVCDQLCADHGVFNVENLCNLSVILEGNKEALFNAGTYPLNFEGQTGLPCRVIARVGK